MQIGIKKHQISRLETEWGSAHVHNRPLLADYYLNPRLTPSQIVAAAVEEDVRCVGLSILSGSHMELVPDVIDGLREAGLDDVPVVVGGIIPEGDAKVLEARGVAAVFTPKDYDANTIMFRILNEIRKSQGLAELRL